MSEEFYESSVHLTSCCFRRVYDYLYLRVIVNGIFSISFCINSLESIKNNKCNFPFCAVCRFLFPMMISLLL